MKKATTLQASAMVLCSCLSLCTVDKSDIPTLASANLDHVNSGCFVVFSFVTQFLGYCLIFFQ